MPLDVAPGELQQGAWDREQVRVLFDQLAFRTLLPRLLEAVGDGAAVGAAGAETLDVEVEVPRDTGAVVELLREVAQRGEPFALEPHWDGLPVTSPLRALAVAAAATRRVHRRRAATRRCGARRRSARWSVRVGRRSSPTARRS